MVDLAADIGPAIFPVLMALAKSFINSSGR